MAALKKVIMVGIDEAGRGPLAGAVAVGVVMILQNHKKLIDNNFKELKSGKGFKDSKKLSTKKREEIFKKIKELARKGKLKYLVQYGSVKIIDKEGITRAIAQTMARALQKLKINPRNSEILLDGSLKAPKEFKNQKTIIKGDEKELAIALASIATKVTRDKLMRRLSKKYPKYKFEVHKGYGTRAHRQAIEKYGLSLEHRQLFCRNIISRRRST